MKQEHFEAFVKTSTAYYTNKLEQYEQGKKFTFNLYAFLFSIFWFAYRKMYLHAFLISVLITLLSITEEKIIGYYGIYDDAQIKSIDLICNICLAIAYGFTANYLYIKHAIKKVGEVAQNFEGDESLLHQALERKGGTNSLIVTILILIGIICSIITASVVG